MKNWTLIEWAILAIVVVLLPLAIYGSYKEQQRWDQFVIDHKCRVTSRIAATTSTTHGYGLKADGSMGSITTTTTTPAKTAWVCDDEITYWR